MHALILMLALSQMTQESIDVPAIGHYYDAAIDCKLAMPTLPDSMVKTTKCTERKSKYTCADKTRILLHDEQTPPKYYCHKVQP